MSQPSLIQMLFQYSTLDRNLNNHSENDYSPPNIKSCDSFISVNSDNSDSEIDSDDEPMQLNLKSDNPTSDNPTSDETYYL